MPITGNYFVNKFLFGFAGGILLALLQLIVEGVHLGTQNFAIWTVVFMFFSIAIDLVSNMFTLVTSYLYQKRNPGTSLTFREWATGWVAKSIVVNVAAKINARAVLSLAVEAANLNKKKAKEKELI